MSVGVGLRCVALRSGVVRLAARGHVQWRAVWSVAWRRAARVPWCLVALCPGR